MLHANWRIGKCDWRSLARPRQLDEPELDTLVEGKVNGASASRFLNCSVPGLARSAGAHAPTRPRMDDSILPFRVES